MPRTIDRTKAIPYKTARKQGKSKAAAYMIAGGSRKTAYHDIRDNKLVNACERELQEEFRAQDISCEYVLQEIISGLNEATKLKNLVAKKGFLELLTKIFFVERHHLATHSEDIPELKNILSGQIGNIHTLILSQISMKPST